MSPAASYSTISGPYTGNLYARVPNCGAEEARVAIAAAHEAFGPWAETPPAEKAHLDQRHQR
jgi:succinate-semialdehyde dehydrogenase/glutarate-semialdehyde dehydrogenase